MSETASEIPPPLLFTDAAAAKVKELIDEEDNPSLMLRVFVSGGGCSGFQYGFTFDESTGDGDTEVENGGVTLLIDPHELSVSGRCGDRLHRRAGRRSVRHPQSQRDHHMRLRLLVLSLNPRL